MEFNSQDFLNQGWSQVDMRFSGRFQNARPVLQRASPAPAGVFGQQVLGCGPQPFVQQQQQRVAFGPQLPVFGEPQVRRFTDEALFSHGLVPLDQPVVPGPPQQQYFGQSPFRGDSLPLEGMTPPGQLDALGDPQDVYQLPQTGFDFELPPTPYSLAEEAYAGRTLQMAAPAFQMPVDPELYAGEHAAGWSYPMAPPAQLPPYPVLAAPAAPVEQPTRRRPGRPRKHPPKDPNAPKRSAGRPKGRADTYKRLAKGEKVTMTKEGYKQEVSFRKAVAPLQK
ncbi:Nn.00g081920.m01.CDS01 [Neocucurbitaria sp. VM-36]